MASEKRLIDANALKDAFCDACSTFRRYKRAVEDCRNKQDSYGHNCFKMRLIDSATTIDVVAVVRCKECKHCTPDENIVGGYGDCFYKDDIHSIVNADDFCSYGERKDNG